jgi:D-alanyl-lipoteichoic acid acyltransferase DltB (MBOAT superfamily)
MLFNSLTFLVFLPIVFVLYWLVQNRSLRLQNALLIAASYIFYGWWDYRFLSLIIISSLVDYLVGLALSREEQTHKRRLLLSVSVLTNLGILGFFKYFNFFIASFADILAALGLHVSMPALSIVLPVGISFYTFQTMSYTIDIYRREISATRDPISFFAFVSFFPQLVAGPIERAKSLLPQFEKRREFDLNTATDGLRQALWGMLKKVVIADNLAAHVDAIYGNWSSHDGLTLVIATFFFAIQIYCDFSGYSDIAIGVGRLFGFSLRRNFAFPYFSRDIGEFWRRWHISLSTWFRDYVFIPLGGNRVGQPRHIFNIVVTFVVSGLWHGANWTFVIWGLLHGLYYVGSMYTGSTSRHKAVVAEGHLFPRPTELLQLAFTFVLVLISWVFFRARSLSEVFGIFSHIGSSSFYNAGYWHMQYASYIVMAAILLAVEWIQRNKQHALQIEHTSRAWRWAVYIVCTLTILILGNFGEVDFIYFQF